ncbi:hypothetical protein GALL_173390 [mine drainage metagenome]|uniref:Outer membrane protein beta-barrel domain-containing protein n=1 Tax=mine drainage metagenome TaxID=410659 RepID=A0A1J5RXI2_9ZZZZ
MQSVNDDMDDLFRRAAENYPLKTDGADFNKVLAGLQSADKGNVAPVKTKNKSRRLLWLLVLLPFIWICNGNYFKSDKNVASIDKNTITHKGSADNNAENNITEQHQQTDGEKQVDANEPVTHSSQSPKQKYLIEKPLLSNIANNNLPFTDKKKDIVFADEKKQNNTSVQQNENDVKNNEKINSDAIQLGSVLKSNTPKTEIADTAAKNSSDDLSKENAAQKKTHTIKKEKRFYAGVMIGPDASTVKMQSINNIGLSKGIIAGYQLNKRLSIETGVMWDKKYYYSDGKYFSTKNLPLPPTVTIRDVEGDCNMIELPVSLRYIFKSSRTIKWTGSLGFSSYLMKNENYDYTYDNSGSIYQRYKTYNTASDFWFSMMNLSIGYNRKLGKIGDLRIEPFIKIPLKGVGIGTLPITSTGINIGLTRKLF